MTEIKMDRYTILGKLGEGFYGTVLRVIEKETNRLFALKTSLLETGEQGISAAALREISLLYALSKAVHVARLTGVEEAEFEKGKPVLCMAFEYVDSDLKKVMHSYRYGPTRGPIPAQTVKKYLYQLCEGVAHCRRYGALHGALHPGNVLVDEETDLVKIAHGERGFGRAFPTKLVSNLWYRAPEILLGTTESSAAVDMWAVGCIFAEMVKGEELFPGNSDVEQLRRIFILLGTPTEKEWPGVSWSLTMKGWPRLFLRWKPQPWKVALPSLEQDGVDLLSRMLRYDPARRISAAAALDHPFFDGLQKSQLQQSTTGGPNLKHSLMSHVPMF